MKSVTALKHILNYMERPGATFQLSISIKYNYTTIIVFDNTEGGHSTPLVAHPTIPSLRCFLDTLC